MMLVTPTWKSIGSTWSWRKKKQGLQRQNKTLPQLRSIKILSRARECFLMILLSQTSCWPSLRPMAQTHPTKPATLLVCVGHTELSCFTLHGLVPAHMWSTDFICHFLFLLNIYVNFQADLQKRNLLKYSEDCVASQHVCSSSQHCFSIQISWASWPCCENGIYFRHHVIFRGVFTDKLHN